MSGSNTLVTVDTGGFRVDGPITIELAPVVVETGGALLAAACAGHPDAPLSIDLSGLTEFDSAALGVLFEWQRRVVALGGQLHFANLPAKLRTLAGLYGVEALLVPTPGA